MRALMLGAGVLFAGAAVSWAAMAGDVRVVSSKGAEILAKYKPTGQIESCVLLRQIDQMTFVEDSIIMVKMNSGKRYFNQTSNDCNGARGNRRIEYTVSTPTLCRNEIIRVVDNGSGMFMGSCALGDFEHVEARTEG